MKSSRSFTNLSANNWQAGSVYSNRYFNTFEYDAMGNILTQKRHKQDGTQIEDMTYRYQRDANGFLLSNRLYHVNDAIDSTIDATDIDDQGAGFDPLNVNINGAYNYVYDEEGRLIKDKAEDIQQIVWRVDGKVKEINRSTGSTMARLKFDYDAMGRRIAKHVYNNQTGLLEKSTYYLLDAQGNTMATYDYAQAPNQTMSFELKERHIYGSSRLGMYAESVTLVENPSSETNNTVVNQGFKYYEMTNHLGNVLTVIHDIKIPLNNGSGPAVSSHRVGIRTCSDYSPFGVELDGRTVSGGYRYGYQGSEKDNEFKGNGNSYTTEFRQLDPRLGRWLSVDPVIQPWQSSYCSMDCNPVFYIDPTGTSSGDYYTKDGQYMGSDEKNDDIGYVVNKADVVYKADGKTVDANKTIGEVKFTDEHKKFAISSNIVKAESSGNKIESLWIAHTANNAWHTKDVGKGRNFSLYEQLMDQNYSTTSSKVRVPLSYSDNSQSAKNARAGVIDVLTGGPDPTHGSVLWDGQDFLRDGLNHNKFEEYISVNISPYHMAKFYEENMNNVIPSVDFKSNYYSSKTLTFQGTGKYYNLHSTMVHGGTIFWKIETPEKRANCAPSRNMKQGALWYGQ